MFMYLCVLFFYFSSRARHTLTILLFFAHHLTINLPNLIDFVNNFFQHFSKNLQKIAWNFIHDLLKSKIKIIANPLVDQNRNCGLTLFPKWFTFYFDTSKSHLNAHNKFLFLFFNQFSNQFATISFNNNPQNIFFYTNFTIFYFHLLFRSSNSIFSSISLNKILLFYFVWIFFFTQ